MLDWETGQSIDEPLETVHPSLPVLLSFLCGGVGLGLGTVRSLPLNALGYLVSTFLALSLNARYWRSDIEARRNYLYTPGGGLRILAGLCVALGIVAAGINVWKIAYYFATR